MIERTNDWNELMRAAGGGDEAAYRRLLSELAGFLRAVLRRRAAGLGLGAAELEDVLQETLLAIHLKRGAWAPDQPVAPWVAAIARNKMVDALRRRGRRLTAPIEDFADTLAAPEPAEELSSRETARLLAVLSGRQRQVVEALTVEGEDVKAVAGRLNISEGAVRVALHRGLAALSAAYRSFRE